MRDGEKKVVMMVMNVMRVFVYVGYAVTKFYNYIRLLTCRLT